MKKMLLVIVAVLGMATVSFGSPVVEESSPKISIWHGLLTKYVGTDAVVYSPKPVMQHEATIDLSHGFSADIFWSANLASKSDENNGGDEVDYKVAYAAPYGFELSVSYWDFYPLFGGKSGNAIAPEVKWSHEFKTTETVTLSMHSSFSWYKPTGGSEFTGGARGDVGLDYSKALTDSLSFEATLNLVRDDGSFDTEAAWVVSPSVGFSYVYKGLTIGTKVTAYKPFTVTENRRNQIVGEFSLGWGF